ncbi:hypothetical protein ASE00_18430 [Sphingomonas sp. Root710]|uniref:COG4223 family protein n=1 Tax=Sphingomonas sp. Root710 TaxID=1736594 RepID=UPI0006F7F9FE|nr:hypothetical protein [Sphingomonas sp. Root710]KRB79693.1 hypothetical protein ASE00_18430 [Sphingomonas sp. Root710]
MPDPADAYGPRRRSVTPILVLMIIALLIGMGGMAWLFHRYESVSELIKPEVPVIVPPAPARRPALVNIAPPPPSDVVETIVDQRIDRIEEQVADIGERAAAATGEAHRAEGLLVAFAVRRAIDRGAPLGYLEAMLRERFGGVEPQSVATVISASRQPVTIDALREQLDTLTPQLSVASPDEGWWEGFRRELAGLIVVRQTTAPPSTPVDRVARAQDDLAAGRVDAALIEIARLPGRKAAGGWIAEARRYVQARTALDRIESAALLQPAKVGE